MYQSDHPIRKLFRLFFTVIGVVLILSFLKILIHWTSLEFLTLNALFTSAIAAAVFIIGFLLSSVLADYKEAERMPADMRAAMEAIHDDTRLFPKASAEELAIVRKNLLDIVSGLHEALDRDGGHDLRSVIAHVDALTETFAALEAKGMPPNYIVRLRAEQSALRRSIFRIYHMQRIQFVPSSHVLVQTLVLAVVLLLLFLQTEGSPESALIFGAISYMFIYALYLVNTLEQPFRKRRHSLDDVSMFLLREFSDKIREAEKTPLVERR